MRAALPLPSADLNAWTNSSGEETPIERFLGSFTQRQASAQTRRV